MARPAFKVTAAKRKEVELMKADGWSDDRIAAQFGISRTTLLKHFGKELEYGADKVRREQLVNLSRASKKLNVAAAKALLARADTVAVAPPAADEAPTPSLGKKEIANRDAQTAEQGTSWDGLLKH
jgi:hypothetical protein